MAVTADQPSLGQRNPGHVMEVPLAANTILYENTIVFLNAAGFAVSAAASATFFGVLRPGLGPLDNTGGAAGDLVAEVYQEGVFRFPMSGAADTDRGIAAEAVDNYAVQALSAGVRCGTVVNVPESGIAEVEIDVQV